MLPSVDDDDDAEEDEDDGDEADEDDGDEADDDDGEAVGAVAGAWSGATVFALALWWRVRWWTVVVVPELEASVVDPAVRLIVWPGKAWAATSVRTAVPATATATRPRLIRRRRRIAASRRAGV
ncbi:MAG TPA: hypothetical protein VG165_00055 [Solirubrobacteraceae bacterium]|nr:hypothetical protein [Solirubrobacteraceae bacterium]